MDSAEVKTQDYIFSVGKETVMTPGLKVQAGTFDPESGLKDAALRLSALLTFGLLTAVIAWIERRRTPKLNLET